MANGLQIAASALIAQQWRLDSVANDIANVNTVGYRQTRGPLFTELMSADGGVLATTAGTTKAQAPLTPSDNPLSIALTGPGYLLVTTAAGTDALTRNGNLRIDGAPNLVLDGGERLKPPVKIPAEVADDDDLDRPGRNGLDRGPRARKALARQRPGVERARGSRRRHVRDDDRERRRLSDQDGDGAAGRDRRVERRSRRRDDRDAGGAAQLLAREPRHPHPGSAPRDRKRDPPLMTGSLPITALPADVRADGAHGRKLYEAALGFEQELVRTIAAQLTATAESSGDEESAGDAASGLIKDQLPELALADGILASGGLGLAHDLYGAMRLAGKRAPS